MKRGVLLLWTLAAVSASAWAQERGYPITIIRPGRGPYQFPQGYQTPWDKIEIIGVRFTLGGSRLSAIWRVTRDSEVEPLRAAATRTGR
jgi:hypothetical protein